MSTADFSDVVVVGAGLSGLVSALRLLDTGVTRPSSITVLEGRSRVGGRLQIHQGESIGALCHKSNIYYCCNAYSYFEV